MGYRKDVSPEKAFVTPPSLWFPESLIIFEAEKAAVVPERAS